MERKIAMSEHERKYNLPMTAIAVIGIASIVACALGPSIAAFAKAGSEDGFTLEALDYEPSGWWAVGLMLFFAGGAFLAWFFLRVISAGPKLPH